MAFKINSQTQKVGKGKGKVLFQKIHRHWSFLFFFALFFSQISWASQEAIVISEKALIYSDEQMSSPVGYVRRGKKVKIGEIPRNRAQVYPIVVSGKVAFIRAIDVSTEKEAMNSERLVAERFMKATQEGHRTRYSAYFFTYNSQISMSQQNDSLMNKDPVNWTGAGLKGEMKISPRWDFQIIANYMTAKKSKEEFKVFELGGGAAFQFLEIKRFLARIEMQVLGVPFATYSLDPLFRVRGSGFTTGGGLNLSYLLGENWGLDAGAGFYYTKLIGFDSPSPYRGISPTFIGTRLNLGLYGLF